MSPQEQRRLLQRFNQAYPDIIAFLTFDAVGNAITRSDDLPLSPSLAGVSVFETARRTGEPILDIRMGRVLKRPIFAFIVPMQTPDGQFAGVATGAITSSRIADQLAQASSSKELIAYLVDAQGRVIAHPKTALVESFTDYSQMPSVAALLAKGGSTGELQYQGKPGTKHGGCDARHYSS